MTRVLLIHAGRIPHYRIPIYSYLSSDLLQYNFDLFVISDSIQPDNPHSIDFKFVEMPLSTFKIAQFVDHEKIDVIIDYMELRHLYLFPTYFITKCLMRKKMIYWGQGCDLADTKAWGKNLAYAIELFLCDAIILYAEHLIKYTPKYLHKKVFIANNTLCINYKGFSPGVTKESILRRYGIATKNNIICMGRMQKRKRVDILVEALADLNRPDIGLILVGPDADGVLDNISGNNIYKLGPIYGDQKFDLLSAADVYCLPGAVGLSIIDAFQCGLPFITEEGDESAEIMYLKDNVNGFIVGRGNVRELGDKIKLLIDNASLREKFSAAAKKEIQENGSMEKMSAGFRDALCYATGTRF